MTDFSNAWGLAEGTSKTERKRSFKYLGSHESYSWKNTLKFKNALAFIDKLTSVNSPQANLELNQ